MGDVIGMWSKASRSWWLRLLRELDEREPVWVEEAGICRGHVDRRTIGRVETESCRGTILC